MNPYVIINSMKKSGKKKDILIKSLKLQNLELKKKNAWLQSRCVQLLVVKKLKRKKKYVTAPNIRRYTK